MNSRGYGCEEWKHEHECERCRERKIWMGMCMELMNGIGHWICWSGNCGYDISMKRWSVGMK